MAQWSIGPEMIPVYITATKQREEPSDTVLVEKIPDGPYLSRTGTDNPQSLERVVKAANHRRYQAETPPDDAPPAE